MPLQTGAAILCFHSLTTAARPAEGSAHVPLDFFKASVRLARQMGELVPLAELVSRHQNGRSTRGLIAITLDDAYAALDGAFRAFVEGESVPVTVFAVTRAGNGARYWWDRVDDAFPRVPVSRQRAFEDACGLPDEYRRGQPAAFGPLRPLRQWILARHAGRWPAALEPALDTLESDAGTSTCHRPMTWEELTSLSSSPCVDIGVHTDTHPVLPLLEDEELRREILSNADALRERLGRVAPIVAAPFGLYDRRTVDIAVSAGMSACLTLEGTAVDRGSPGCVLPRMCVTTADTRVTLALRLSGMPQRFRGRFGRPGRPLYPALPSATT
jgi:peptidoglycan/xylan/chitin deacetylase (PgdA/CDA1 family)